MSSTSDSFTIKLTVERIGGTLGSVLVSYNTPGITHESISIGSYTASNAQIGSHYLSADGTLNFTGGLTKGLSRIFLAGTFFYIRYILWHPKGVSHNT